MCFGIWKPPITILLIFQKFLHIRLVHLLCAANLQRKAFPLVSTIKNQREAVDSRIHSKNNFSNSDNIAHQSEALTALGLEHAVSSDGSDLSCMYCHQTKLSTVLLCIPIREPDRATYCLQNQVLLICSALYNLPITHPLPI